MLEVWPRCTGTTHPPSNPGLLFGILSSQHPHLSEKHDGDFLWWITEDSRSFWSHNALICTFIYCSGNKTRCSLDLYLLNQPTLIIYFFNSFLIVLKYKTEKQPLSSDILMKVTLNVHHQAATSALKRQHQYEAVIKQLNPDWKLKSPSSTWIFTSQLPPKAPTHHSNHEGHVGSFSEAWVDGLSHCLHHSPGYFRESFYM